MTIPTEPIASLSLDRDRAELELRRAKETLERRTQELNRSLAILRATLDAATDGILVLDKDGRVSDFNQRLVRMWRLPQEIVASREVKLFLDFMAGHLRDPAILRAGAADMPALAGENFDLLELTDGRFFERFSQIQRVEGGPIGRVWSFRDVTERQRTDAAQFRLAALVESSNDAIVSKTLNGIIETWNAAAQRLFGYTAEEVIGRHVSVLIPAHLQDEEPRIIEQLKKGERIEHYETLRQRKDGTTFHVSLTVSPIKNDNGEVIGASKIARDITERKQIEELLRRDARSTIERRLELERQVDERTASLREAVAQMEEFSYSVSHDLRAPLRAMQAYASALLEDYAAVLDDQGRDYLQRIVTAGLRLDRLTQDVLTYSKIPRTALHLERVSLEKLVDEIIRQYIHEAHHAHITVASPLLDLRAHESLLAQAVSNLVGNAVKFSRPGKIPEIHLRTEARGDQVRFWVEDDGIGIKPEYQPRIWGMFERVHAQNPYEGTGIGLAIVRKAVERMNGTAGVESDGSSGSKFWIQLPAP